MPYKMTINSAIESKNLNADMYNYQSLKKNYVLQLVFL